jgi:hypothetical protein
MKLYPTHFALRSIVSKIGIQEAFKKGHSAKSAQERRRTNYHMRAHPRDVTAVTAKAAVSPAKHFNT